METGEIGLWSLVDKGLRKRNSEEWDQDWTRFREGPGWRRGRTTPLSTS